MGPHLFLQETLLAEHRREMMREMEQRRLIACGLPHSHYGVRHSIALIGKVCIMLGQWLERVESRQAVHGVVYAGTGPLHVGAREPHTLN